MTEPVRTGRPTVRGRVVAAVVVGALLALELLVKELAKQHLSDRAIDVGFIDLRLVFNTGVAFSLGNTVPVGVVVAVTGLITAGIVVYAWRTAEEYGPVARAAVLAIIAGAAANLVDRAVDGAVTDYLDLGWWPVFNLADVFIVTGGAVVVLSALKGSPKSPPTASGPQDE